MQRERRKEQLDPRFLDSLALAIEINALDGEARARLIAALAQAAAPAPPSGPECSDRAA